MPANTKSTQMSFPISPIITMRSFNIDYQLFTSFVLIVKLSKSKTHHHTVHVKIVPNDLIEKNRIFPSILQCIYGYM